MSKNKKELRININYINLVEKLIKNKIEIKENNNIENLYIENLNLRYSNKERVINRIFRKEINKELKEILKERNIDYNKFLESSNKLKDLNNKSSYIKVEI